MSSPNLSALIWAVAERLRGDYRQSEYGKVILPFVVLRRLDCVLAPTKAAVLVEKVAREQEGLDPALFMQKVTGLPFCNLSPLDLTKITGASDNIAENLKAYVQAFSPAVRDIFDHFDFGLQLEFAEYELPDDRGRISALEAKLKAESEFEVFRLRQDAEYVSDFDREVRRIEGKPAKQAPKGDEK